MESGSGPAPVVLLVEDDPGVRTALRRLLAHEGLPAVGAATLAEARALLGAGSETLRVVVVDIGLGQESGLDFAEEIRRRSDPVRVVVFSAQGERVAPGRFLACGVSEVLSKPASPSEIVAAVRRALGHGAPGATGEWGRTHPSRGEHRAS